MNYAAIYECDTANGVGCRTSVFVSGCRRHCKNCHNQQAWDFEYGNKLNTEVREYISSTLNHKYIDGISILGGEPFERENQIEVWLLAHSAKELGKSVWIYTGYTFEELMKNAPYSYIIEILHECDVLVDGPFVEEKKDLTLDFRGSSNQRIIDVPSSMKSKSVVLLKM